MSKKDDKKDIEELEEELRLVSSLIHSGCQPVTTSLLRSVKTQEYNRSV